MKKAPKRPYRASSEGYGALHFVTGPGWATVNGVRVETSEPAAWCVARASRLDTIDGHPAGDVAEALGTPLPTTPATLEPWATEPGAKYYRLGPDILRDVGGRLTHYCVATLWPQSSAARRARLAPEQAEREAEAMRSYRVESGTRFWKTALEKRETVEIFG